MCTDTSYNPRCECYNSGHADGYAKGRDEGRYPPAPPVDYYEEVLQLRKRIAKLDKLVVNQHEGIKYVQRERDKLSTRYNRRLNKYLALKKKYSGLEELLDIIKAATSSS